MARRRRLRKTFTRNRSIALGIAVIAFAVVFLGGADIVTTLFQAGWYQGANFSVQIFDFVVPLQFASNFALSCTVWTESQMNFLDGSSRPLTSGNIVLSESNFNLAVIDVQTLKEVNNISGEVNMRCSSPVQVDSITISSGQLITQVDLTKTDDFKTATLSGTQNIPRTNVLVGSQGARLDTFNISAEQISNAISTNSQDYQVSMLLLNQLDVTLEARASGVTSSARTVVLFNSWTNGIGVRVQGDGSGTPLPVDDNRVLIFTSNPSTLDLEPDGRNLFLTSLINLPQYQTFESEPTLQLFRTSPTTGRETGSALFTAGPRQQNVITGSTPSGQPIPATTFRSDLQLAGAFTGFTDITPNIYISIATSPDRSGTDFRYLQVIDANQSPTAPIPPDEPDPTDPCEQFTGIQLQSCEVSRGQLLSCQEPTYVKIDRIVYDAMITAQTITPFIIQLEPGTMNQVNEFTTFYCMAQQSIDQFNALGGGMCTDVNFIFSDTLGVCVCQYTASSTTPVDQCVPEAAGTVLSAKTVLFYDVVYEGSQDFGIIEGQPVVFSVTGLQLASAGQEEVFALSRLHIAPVIDVTDIPQAFGPVHSGKFDYTWTAKLQRIGTSDADAIEIGILEECKAVTGGATTCPTFDMNSVGVETTGTTLGLTVIDAELRKTMYYQIARSDIRPDQIVKVLGSKDVTLADGDLIDLKLVVKGTFLVGMGESQRVGAIAPMEFVYQFTWADALGPDGPCAGLMGEEFNRCVNPTGATNNTENNCLSGETTLDCWKRNHPVTTSSTGSSGATCRQAFIGGVIKKICEGPTASTTPGVSSSSPGSNNNPEGTTNTAGIGDCPEGTTASQCADIILRILEQRLAGFLGTAGPVITTLSNNAVLIIGSVIAIIVIAVIARAAINRKKSRF